MTSQPESHALVSIIVPTWNSSRTLEACLTSVRNQTYKEIELIVVDNQSTDGSLAIAKKYADRVAVNGPERSAQRNHGAELSRGDFLLFIDSDMQLGSTVVSEAVEVEALTGARAVVIPEDSFGEGFWSRCRELERSCYPGDDLVESARFFPRNVFAAVGGYDETLTGAEDWDLSQRVALRERLPRTVARIAHDEGRIGLASTWAKRRYRAEGYWKCWSKHKRLGLLRANIVARRAFFRHWRQLARHPLLTPGMFFLKALELAAVTYGVVGSNAHLIRRRTSAPVR